MYFAVYGALTVPSGANSARDERGGDVSLVHGRCSQLERRERTAVNRRQRRLRSFPVNRRRVP